MSALECEVDCPYDQGVGHYVVPLYRLTENYEGKSGEDQPVTQTVGGNLKDILKEGYPPTQQMAAINGRLLSFRWPYQRRELFAPL